MCRFGREIEILCRLGCSFCSDSGLENFIHNLQIFFLLIFIVFITYNLYLPLMLYYAIDSCMRGAFHL